MEQQNSNLFFKRIQMWSDSETRLLLDKYTSYFPNIGPMKALRNKKEMWEKIASEVEGRTAKQCEERYKTILKRRKNAVDNNHTSGAKRQRVEYQEEFETIIALDDTIEPEVMMSSQAVQVRVPVQPSSSSRVREGERKKTVQETMLEIANRKEEAKERRHAEKMQSLNNIQQILAELLNKN